MTGRVLFVLERSIMTTKRKTYSDVVTLGVFTHDVSHKVPFTSSSRRVLERLKGDGARRTEKRRGGD